MRGFFLAVCRHLLARVGKVTLASRFVGVPVRPKQILCYFHGLIMSIMSSSIEMRIAIGILLISSITACSSGGGGSASSSSQAPPPTTNNPPTISGSPATAVTQDQPYLFTPVASDPDGDTLTYTLTNQPLWAEFDPDTGSLTGTPSDAHIGKTLDVTITVSDGNATASLAPFDLEVLEMPLGSATVSWDIPSTNADGSDLADLAGFYVHYGQAPQTYSEIVVINDDTATSAVINDLAAGSWFFIVTAFDQSGNESAPSTEVSKVVDP